MILVNYRDLTTGKSTNIEHLEGLRYLLNVALLMSSKDFFLLNIVLLSSSKEKFIDNRTMKTKKLISKPKYFKK